MIGRSRRGRAKKRAANASALALALAQDKRFRKRLLSGIRHGFEAGRRMRSELGLSGAVARLATDETLLKELRRARGDLERAYGRLEAKRRTHKLRTCSCWACSPLWRGCRRLGPALLLPLQRRLGSSVPAGGRNLRYSLAFRLPSTSAQA